MLEIFIGKLDIIKREVTELLKKWVTLNQVNIF